WELGRVLDVEVVRDGLRRLAPMRLIAHELEPLPSSAHARVAALETSLYMRNQLLRDTDWASMAHSLEVRVPLVDAQLLQRIAPAILAAKRRAVSAPKASLARSTAKPLPPQVVARAKTGFTTPIAHWLKNATLLRGGITAPRRRVPLNAHWSRQWAERLAFA